MSTTVHECFINAQCNFENVIRLGGGKNPIFMIAMEQLNNGLAALENGKNLEDVIQEDMFSEVTTGA